MRMAILFIRYNYFYLNYLTWFGRNKARQKKLNVKSIFLAACPFYHSIYPQPIELLWHRVNVVNIPWWDWGRSRWLLDLSRTALGPVDWCNSGLLLCPVNGDISERCWTANMLPNKTPNYSSKDTLVTLDIKI